MLKVASTELMRKIEAAADAGGYSYADMMQAAGRAAADRARELLAQLPEGTQAGVTVLVGPGNNGGDGLVAGLLLAQETGTLVRFYLLKRREDDDPVFKPVREAGLFVAHAEDDQRYRVLTNMVASANIVIDALFGIGFKPPFRDEVVKIMRAIRAALNEGGEEEEVERINPTQARTSARPLRPFILAIDSPSGLDTDTGALDPNTLHADETITFIAAKPGLLTFPGASSVGKLTIAPIGIPNNLPELRESKYAVMTVDAARDLLPARPADANKGTFGKALIAAGSVNYTGAPALSARAAYRAGTGLVTVAAPIPVVEVLAANNLEMTWLLLPHDMGVIAADAAALVRKEAANYSALLLGPGMGREKTTREFLISLLSGSSKAPAKPRPIGFGARADERHSDDEAKLPPLVIDADGLNLLSEIENWPSLLPPNTILTPHPGEMGRLAGIETADVQARRWDIAAEKAVEWKVILLLKGAHTLVANPNGEVVALPFKTPALATAGTGDVLAGIIVGLLAQGMKPFDAALLGGTWHALAGEQVAKQRGTARGVVAGDVLEAIGAAALVLEG
jgi:ADP-dependent NAD(P)H-hydrate dehydratase / NAD(P)H-hydrate epimerase